jgi:HlyD family secretion protein
MESKNNISHVTQYRRPWWKGARQWWPLLVFILISILAVLLYSNGGKYRVMSGTAERIVETIAPIETARIVSVHVLVGDRVHAGDIIAQLDTSLIDAESAVIKEQITQSRLESQLEQLTLERQFASARQQAEQALRDAQRQFQVETVEHEALLEEIARLEPLFEQQLISMEALVTKQASERVLREKLKSAPQNIRALIADVAQAKQQQESALTRLAERKEKLRSEVETVNYLNLRRDAYCLRAREDGVIAQVDHRAGDIVESGDTIASLLIDGPSSIVGFLPESNLSAIAVGTPANIYPSVSIRDTGVVSAHVVQISPAVYSLPERVSPIRGQIVRGRRVTLALDTQVQLVPGETVSIEMESSLFEPVSLED